MRGLEQPRAWSACKPRTAECCQPAIASCAIIPPSPSPNVRKTSFANTIASRAIGPSRRFTGLVEPGLPRVHAKPGRGSIASASRSGNCPPTQHSRRRPDGGGSIGTYGPPGKFISGRMKERLAFGRTSRGRADHCGPPGRGRVRRLEVRLRRSAWDTPEKIRERIHLCPRRWLQADRAGRPQADQGARHPAGMD